MHVPCSRVALLVPLAAALLVAGCESEKSANPLSPNVAGPIPGVTITAPKALEPVNGSKVEGDKQPITLLIESPTTNGERSLWIDLEVATDAGFTGKVHSAARLSPGAGGRTSYKLPEALQTGRSYYWRSRGLDGANSSDWSVTASFEVIVPAFIAPPAPVSPVNASTTATNAPEMVVTNGAVTGITGAVTYRFEVSLVPTFTTTAAVVTVPRDPGGTTRASLGTLPYATEFFWRVSGSNGVITSAYTAVQSFRTPAAPAPPPPPPPTPTPNPNPTPPPAPGPGPTPGNRTPNPPAGQRLPLPNMAWVVEEVARTYPNALRNSCQEQGGTWEFMDRVVDRLRQYDTRWGYNCKRGDCNHPSLDVVDYNWGSRADEGTTDVYIIDILGGHCGSNPTPAWIDQTQVTLNSGTIGRWTSRGRF